MSRRIPTALKIAAGNPGKRPLNKLEPSPAPLEMHRPEHLSETALRYWDEYAPMLLRLKVLTEADRNALVRLCDLLSQLEQASQTLREEGLIVHRPRYDRNGERMYDGETPVTMVEKNPMFLIQMELDKQVKTLMVEFGLTPASRTKVTVTGIPEKATADPLTELRARAKRSR